MNQQQEFLTLLELPNYITLDIYLKKIRDSNLVHYSNLGVGGSSPSQGNFFLKNS